MAECECTQTPKTMQAQYLIMNWITSPKLHEIAENMKMEDAHSDEGSTVC